MAKWVIMLLNYKFDFIQHLQQVYALYLHDSISDHQRPFTFMSAFAALYCTGYNKRMNELFISILTHLYPFD